MKMMVVIFMSSLMMLITFQHIFIYVDYYVNRDYIIDELCINRAEPENMCSGTCYIQSKIGGLQQDNFSFPTTSKIDSKLIVTFLPFNSYFNDWHDVSKLKGNVFSPALTIGSSDYIDDIDHPPIHLLS